MPYRCSVCSWAMSDLVGIAAGSNTNDVPFILDCLYDEAQCRTDTVDWFIKQFLAYCGFPCCIKTPGSKTSIENYHRDNNGQVLTAVGCASLYPSSVPFSILTTLMFIGEKSNVFVCCIKMIGVLERLRDVKNWLWREPNSSQDLDRAQHQETRTCQVKSCKIVSVKL